MLKTKNRTVCRLRIRTFKSGRRFIAGTVSKVYIRDAPHPNPEVVKQAEKVFAGMGIPKNAITFSVQ